MALAGRTHRYLASARLAVVKVAQVVDLQVQRAKIQVLQEDLRQELQQQEFKTPVVRRCSGVQGCRDTRLPGAGPICDTDRNTRRPMACRRHTYVSSQS